MRLVRCFVAIEFEPRTALLLHHVAVALRDAVPAWAGEKWVASHNLHITLKFLGNLPEAVLPVLGEDLAAATSKVDRFEMIASGIEARPSARRCDLMWVSFADPEARYPVLADAVGLLAAEYGVTRDQHRPCPHATLVRSRKAKPISQEALHVGTSLLEQPTGAMSVSCASLLTSTLTRSGPVYDRIAVAPLRTGVGE